MTFHHRIYLVVSVLLIFLLIFFVMSMYVSEFRVVMSVTIHALNVQCIFTSSCQQERSYRIYVSCVYLRIVVSSTYCAVFLCFCLSSACHLPVSLDCPLLIAPSVYLQRLLHLGTQSSKETYLLLLFFILCYLASRVSSFLLIL